MTVFRPVRQSRYEVLRSHHFTPYESRELSKLPKKTPALKQMIFERDMRWERFQKLSLRKLERGQWRKSDLPGKWVKNLSRFYSRVEARVKVGPKGRQQKMDKGSPNPWALYRRYIQATGGDRKKGYRSPWEKKQLRRKTAFDRGQIFIRQSKSGKQSSDTVRHWIAQLRATLAKTRDRHRREQLQAQISNLEGKL